MIELRPDGMSQEHMDEVVGTNCRVHLERMDTHWFCLIIEDAQRRVMLNIGTMFEKRRYRVEAMVYEDEFVR